MTHLSSTDPLAVAIDSLRRPPLTRYALRHFREVAVRCIKKDGTVDLDVARAVLCGDLPAGTVPAEFLEAARVTLRRLGIRPSQPEAFDDDLRPS